MGLGFLLVPLLVYPQFLADDALLYGLDSGQSHFARFRILADALQGEGRLPLWQVTSYAGGPFHANPENPTLYPPVVLLAALFTPVFAMNLTILLHLSLAGFGMYLLTLRVWRQIEAGDASRRRGPATAGLAGAVVAGAFFAFNRYMRLEGFNLVTYAATHALIPWVLLAAHGLLHDRAPLRRAAWLALVLSCQVFAGGHYAFAYTFLALAFWFTVDGLCGGPGPRRRVLVWLPLAAVLTGLLVSAKLLPFLDWVSVTNRGGALPLEDAVGNTMAGEGRFDWSILRNQVAVRTAAFLTFLLAPLALIRFRQRLSWLVLGLGVFGFLAASGLLHELFLAHVPPFDRIRGARRAWTVANAFLPLASGLGLNALLGLFAPARRLSLDTWAGPVLALASLPFLLHTDRFQPEIERPYKMDDVLALYRNWHTAADQAHATDSRVMSLEVPRSGTRNEQFIASALGVETTAGFFGYAYPTRLSRFVYENEGPLDPEHRRKRLSTTTLCLSAERHSSAPGRGLPHAPLLCSWSLAYSSSGQSPRIKNSSDLSLPATRSVLGDVCTTL